MYRPKRHRFRFSMRTILAVITLVAVASWLYWDGWPRYGLHRDRMQFEAFLNQLDGNIEKVSDLIPRERNPFVMCDDDGGYIACELPTHTYLLYFPKRASRHSAHAMEIYRLANAPKDYVPKSEQGWMFGPYTTKRMESQLYYWEDFCEYLSGDRRDGTGFKHKLIKVHPAE
jgi:hypothetical protein